MSIIGFYSLIEKIIIENSPLKYCYQIIIEKLVAVMDILKILFHIKWLKYKVCPTFLVAQKLDTNMVIKTNQLHAYRRIMFKNTRDVN